MWESSNPALTNKNVLSQFGRDMLATRSETTPHQGVMHKTGILIGLALLGGASGYALVATNPSIMFWSALGSFILFLGFGFLLCGKPQMAPIVAPIGDE